MLKNVQKRIFIYMLLSTLLILSTVACNPLTSSQPDKPRQAEGTYPVNPLLVEFYDLLGGNEVLGPATSVLFVHEGKFMQYVHAGLMVYDPNDLTGNRYSLAPIGRKIGFSQSPQALTANDQVVEGYPLYPAFSELYGKVSRFAGQPLTNPVYNAIENRWEQYFENLGFAYDLDQPELGVRLLAYGVYDCDFACRYTPPPGTSIGENPKFGDIPSPFYEAVQRLGDNFVGTPLTRPYVNENGYPEMIFSNIILYYDEDVGRVFASPLARDLGFRRPGVADNQNDAFTFYPVEGETGYNVADQVQAYISQHGGLDIAGLPITDMFQIRNQWWQCFTNLCVAYDTSQPDQMRVHTAALGQMYKELFHNEDEAEVTVNTTQGNQGGIAYAFSVREATPTVRANETQTILVQLNQEGAAKSGSEFTLTLFIPGEAEQHFAFPLTNANGASNLALPIVNAPSTTLIPYEVCYQGNCVQDAYMIWNTE
jgi:hypothetical protein